MDKIIALIVFVSLLFSSCNESGISVFTVQQEEVSSAANGSMLIYVDEPGEPIHFTGHLKLIAGQCVLQLFAPVSDTIFHFDTIFTLDESMLPDSVWMIDSIFVSDEEYLAELMYEEIFEAPADVKFDQYFDRQMGKWEFSYAIAPFENDQPLGDFEFTFKYNN